ncbi:MAG TPA: glycosyltransferase family 4 protein [Planctomycetota bacterium]|nr:glycosyltransferase family 4 protein [Planctomycetota bacterium]
MQHAVPDPLDDSDVSSRILLIAASHGFPQTQARLERVEELSRALAARGAAVDVLLLAERLLQPFEAERVQALKGHARSVCVVEHPAAACRLYRAFLQVGERIRLKPRLGGRIHCPSRLRQEVSLRLAREGCRAVIVRGVHLSSLLSLFPAWTEKIVDLERVGFAAHTSHARHGRADELDVFDDAAREISLLSRAGAVLVASREEAVLLREHGFRGDLILTPPAPPGLPSAIPGAPLRPPRILCVGSDTTANLDGIRWFRRQVFPRITGASPTCRLRLVGEVARHIEPGPGVDRIGWVGKIEEEYANASVVALPLRMGSGLHRRAVEALAEGRALATTTTGAMGIRLVAGRDAIVADDAGDLAVAIGHVLASDEVRQSLERAALALAAESFTPSHAFRGLVERLGLHLSRERSTGVPAVPAGALVTA